MNQTQTTEAILSLCHETERLHNTLEALGTSNIMEMPKNFEALSFDAAMRGEKLAVKLRELVLCGAKADRRPFLLACADAQGIKADFADGILCLTVPRQLPKRKWKNSNYLPQPVMAALAELSKEKELPRFQNAAACFVHVVSQETPISIVRDHDNVETKQILDVINTCLLTDDCGLLCETHQFTERGDKNRTEVYVMAAETFPEWFLSRNKAPGEYPK